MIFVSVDNKARTAKRANPASSASVAISDRLMRAHRAVSPVAATVGPAPGGGSAASGVEAVSPSEPSLPETEPQDAEPTGESEQSSAPPLEIDGEDAQVIEPAIVDAGTTATSPPVDTGVVEPAVVAVREIPDQESERDPK